MNNFLFLFNTSALLLSVNCKAAIAGPALQSLMRAAEADPAFLSTVYDGRAHSSINALPAAVSQNNFPSSIQIIFATPERYLPMPVPELVASVSINSEVDSSNRTPETPMDSNTETPIMSRALETLSHTVSGKPLTDFFKSQKVELRWKPLSSFSNAPAYARACPPEECGENKVIYLNTSAKDKNLFFDTNPSFLAIVLVHELSHLSDYKKMGGGVAQGSSAGLFLEINGWSTETYVYHELLQAGVAPAPKSVEENYAMQQVRLHLAIRDYMGGGPKLSAGDYLNFIKSGADVNKYIYETTKNHQAGMMSLAGLVEYLYSSPTSLEYMKEPGIFASSAKKEDYKKYIKVRESLAASTFEYIKWRKENVDPQPPAIVTPPQNSQPAQQPSSPVQNHHTNPVTPHTPHGAGDNSNGGSSGSSGNTPTVHPPDFGGGTGMDHPSAGNY